MSLKSILSRFAVGGALLLASSGICNAVTLQDLLNGATITVPTSVSGTSLLFNNFTNYFTGNTGGATAPTASQIDVFVVNSNTDHLGLRFQSSNWDVNANQTMSTSWEYDVQTINGPAKMDGVELHFVTVDAPGNGHVHIGKTLSDPVDQIFQHLSVDDPGNLGPDTVLFNQRSLFHVADTVTLDGGTTGNGTLLGNFDQHFQVVNTPEPGTLGLLLGLGVTGTGFVLRRRAKGK